MVKFSQLKSGDRARIVGIEHDSEHGLRLVEMGLTVGTEIEVLKVAPLGDPIEICLRGYRLCLRKHEADGFQLELLTNKPR